MLNFADVCLRSWGVRELPVFGTSAWMWHEDRAPAAAHLAVAQRGVTSEIA